MSKRLEALRKEVRASEAELRDKRHLGVSMMFLASSLALTPKADNPKESKIAEMQKDRKLLDGLAVHLGEDDRRIRVLRAMYRVGMAIIEGDAEPSDEDLGLSGSPACDSSITPSESDAVPPLLPNQDTAYTGLQKCLRDFRGDEHHQRLLASADPSKSERVRLVLSLYKKAQYCLDQAQRVRTVCTPEQMDDLLAALACADLHKFLRTNNESDILNGACASSGMAAIGFIATGIKAGSQRKDINIQKVDDMQVFERELKQAKSLSDIEAQKDHVVVLLCAIGVLHIQYAASVVSSLDSALDELLQQKSNSRCFIATVCCGEKSPEVQALCELRDLVLLRSRAGCQAVLCYYAISPRIAKAITERRLICKLTRSLIVRPMAWLGLRVARARRQKEGGVRHDLLFAFFT